MGCMGNLLSHFFEIVMSCVKFFLEYAIEGATTSCVEGGDLISIEIFLYNDEWILIKVFQVP